MLKIKNLHVEVEGREILHGVCLEIHEGETHVIMGPNASGKTTLVLTILGHPTYRITKGCILFDGMDISRLSVTERVKLGIGVAFQHPPIIKGVKLRDLLRVCAGLEPKNPMVNVQNDYEGKLLEEVGMKPELYLNRDINLGFSGGERKRIELAQILAMRPRLAIFDEPDSGVDIDSLRLIGRKIADLTREFRCATIVITHYRHILPYIRPDVVHVLYAGRLVKSGDPSEIIDELERTGYETFKVY